MANMCKNQAKIEPPLLMRFLHWPSGIVRKRKFAEPSGWLLWKCSIGTVWSAGPLCTTVNWQVSQARIYVLRDDTTTFPVNPHKIWCVLNTMVLRTPIKSSFRRRHSPTKNPCSKKECPDDQMEDPPQGHRDLRSRLSQKRGWILAFLAAPGNPSPCSNLQQWHHWFCGRQPWNSVGFFVEAGSVGLKALDICTFNFNGQAAVPSRVFVNVKVLPLHLFLKSLSIIWMDEVYKAQALVGVTLGVPWQVKKVEETLKSMFLDLVHKHVLAVVKRNILHDNRHHGLKWRASRSVSCVWWLLWLLHILHLSRLDFWMLRMQLRLLHLPLQHLNDWHHLIHLHGWLHLWAEDELQIPWHFPWRHRCDKDGWMGWVGWRTCWARTRSKPSVVAVVTVLKHGHFVLLWFWLRCYEVWILYRVVPLSQTLLNHHWSSSLSLLIHTCFLMDLRRFGFRIFWTINGLVFFGKIFFRENLHRKPSIFPFNILGFSG